MSLIGEKLDKYMKGNALPATIMKGKQIYEQRGYKLDKITTTEQGHASYKVDSDSRTQPYKVEIKNWNKGILATSCSCPYNYGGICKHRVTAIMALKTHLSTQSSQTLVAPSNQFVSSNRVVQIASFDDWVMKSLFEAEAWKNRENTGIKTVLHKALNGVVDADVIVKGQQYQVYFEKLRFNNEYYSTCSCNQKSTLPLCVHKLHTLLEIRKEFGRYNPFDRMRDYTTEKNKLLQEYGFSLADDIKGKFDFKVTENGSLQLLRLDESIQKISTFQQWKTINNTIFRDEAYAYELHTDEATQLENRTVVYVMTLVGKEFLNDVQFEAYSCKINAHGKMSNFKSFESAQFKDFPQLTDDEITLITAIHSINRDGIAAFLKRKDIRLSLGYNYLDKRLIFAGAMPVLEEYVHKQLDTIFELLQHKKVFFAQNPYFSNGNELMPVVLSPERIKPWFVLKEEGEFLVLEGFVNLGKKRVRLSNFNEMESYWVKEYGDFIYKLANPEVANLLAYLPPKGVLKVHKSDFESFFEDFLVPLSQKFALSFDTQHAIVSEALFHAETKVLIKEDGDSLLFIPRFVYTEDSPESMAAQQAAYEEKRKIAKLKSLIQAPHFQSYEFGYDTLTEKCLLRKNQLLLLQRDKTLEQAFFTFLQSQHPLFATQQQFPFVHLSINDALQEGWFFTFVENLKSQQVQLYGLQELKKFRYNSNKAKFSMKSGSGIDWFDLQISIEFGDQKVSLKEVQAAFLKKQNYVALKDGTLGLLPQEWLEKYEHIFKLGKVKDQSIQVSKLHFSVLDDIAADFENAEMIAEIRHKKEKLLQFKALPSVSVPMQVKAQLRDYQQEGLKWLSFLDEFGWGGILADDMGLGKTLQMLSFLQLQKNKHPDATNLVVLPTTLVFNWQAEAAKFCPELKLFVHRGGTRQKVNEHWHEYDIILTTYGMVRSDIDLFKSFPFHYIILDESQAIKNPDSLIAKAVKQLQSFNRLVMTGTPVENNTFDLYSQMDFLNPGLLGGQEFFKTEFANPIDKAQDKIQAAHLRKIVYPFMLKRTKEEVAKDLPEKTESIIFCEMDKKQRKIYEQYREMYRQRLVEKMTTEGREKASFLILEGLLKLRQICDSPAVLNAEEPLENHSAKLEELIREIEENAGEHKILIFSQFLKMLDLIRVHLEKHNIPYEYLDGQTQDRAARVNRFQEDSDCRVFLMSLKAGGVGINLTEADYVYLVDPWWNPAVEQQAIDRTHRIGQKKSVFAYRMICKDTIEEKILLLQDRKRDLAKDLISTEEGFLKKLSQEDIIDLFS